MRQRGEVIKRDQNQVWIQVENPSKACGSCRGCIRLTGDQRPEDLVVQVIDESGEYEAGDEVIVQSETGEIAKALAVLYGVPFVGLFIGYGITRFALGSDPLAGLGAIGGLLAGALIARPITRRMVKTMQQPKIVSRACSQKE